MIMTAGEVLNAIFEDENHVLYAPISVWVTQDQRFRTFAQQYRGKIRRKLRGIRDEEGFADLKFELEVAYWLLQEDRFALEYERREARQGGPDYTVTFRSNTEFNVEARRIRTHETGEERVHKLVDTLADKTRQMPPNVVNVLVISDGAAAGDDLAAAGKLLRGLAERKVETFFLKRGYPSAADFLKQYRQLSGVVFKQPEGGVLWLNSLAKYPIPKPIALALERLLE